ncbi:MAG: class I SAM-dependent methyltransferase [Omnitrophica bacterium]|nr:class I SAM-dependent methyltransferase [Candidatus Omnitrophota bacterium]
MMSKSRKIIKCAKVFLKYLGLYPLIAPRKTRRFFRTIGDAILKYDTSHVSSQILQCKKIIPYAELDELFPKIKTIPMLIMPGKYPDEGGLTLYELITVCAICKYIKPSKIFEFGTFKGNTTLHLTLNSPDRCEINTLDLPPEIRGDTLFPVEDGPITGMSFSVGEKYQGSSLENKINQLYGDSAPFDYTRFYGSMDLIIIDGNHQYDNVKSDSENAFRMLNPEGIILWHDYTLLPDHRGVIQYLNELSSTLKLIRIADTCFVMSRKGDKIHHDC